MPPIRLRHRFAVLLLASALTTGSGALAEPINLGSFPSPQGIVTHGSIPGDVAGYSVSGVGDFNGDGVEDHAIAAPLADGPDGTRTNCGEVYIIFGVRTGEQLPTQLDALAPSEGVTIFGAGGGDGFGRQVAGVGDFNGDGLSDVGITAPNATESGRGACGAVYVILGRSNTAGGVIDLAVTNATGGAYKFFGIDANDRLSAVTGAGDFNGDGYDDLLIGAPLANGLTNNRLYSGEIFLVSGTPVPLAGAFDLSSINGYNGIRFLGGTTGDNAGKSVSGLGDINGDGADDIVIGAPGGDGAADGRFDAGEAYVVFGAGAGALSLVDLGTLNGTNGFVIDAPIGGAALGTYVTGPGDMNQDGFNEIVVAAPQMTGIGGTRGDSGVLFAIYGRTGNWTARYDLLTKEFPQVRKWSGAQASEGIGVLAPGGDWDGDAFMDLVIGSAKYNTSQQPTTNFAGAAYLISPPSAIDEDLDFLTFSTSQFLTGEGQADQAGTSVCTAGDANSDGYADILIAAPYADGPGNTRGEAGAVYTYFGTNQNPQNPTYFTFIGGGNPRNEPVATVGNRTRSIPESRCWIDYADGQLPNLIKNGGCEKPLFNGEIPDWTEVTGASWTQRQLDPTPLEGSNYFYPGAVATAELRQDINLGLTEFGRPVNLSFVGYTRSFNQLPTDAARIVVEIRDGTNTTVLDSYDTGDTTSTAFWQQNVHTFALADSNVFVRIRLISTRLGGNNNDGYFDGLQLYPARGSRQMAAFSRQPIITNLPGALPTSWVLGTDRESWTTARVTFQYLDSDVIPIDESTLRLYRGDSPAGPFVELTDGLTIDPARNRISALTTGLNYFAIAGDLKPLTGWMLQ